MMLKDAFTARTLKPATPCAHVNYAYAQPQACAYPTLPAGATVRVTEPRSVERGIVDSVASECVLQTRCKLSANRPSPRCAHFYFLRECRRGAKCAFAHVLHLDPDAAPLALAPSPNAFGRRRDPKPGDMCPKAYGIQQLRLARATDSNECVNQGKVMGGRLKTVESDGALACFLELVGADVSNETSSSDGSDLEPSSLVITPHATSVEPWLRSPASATVPEPEPPMALPEGCTFWPPPASRTHTPGRVPSRGGRWRHDAYGTGF